MTTGTPPLGRVPTEDVRVRRALGRVGIILSEPSGMVLTALGLSILCKGGGGVLVDASGLYLDATVFVAPTRTITAGTGLTGGGDLSANRTLALAISGLTEDATPDLNADYVATYDTSTSTHKKVLLSKIGSGGGGGTTHYEPLIFADEIVIFNHDIVMVEVPN